MHLEQIEAVAVSMIAPLGEITVSPGAYAVSRKVRGRISGYLPSMLQDKRTRALTLVVDSGEKHYVVCGFRLLTDLRSEIRVGVEVSLDGRTWKRLYFTGGCKPWVFRLYDAQSVLALRFELLGEISRLKGIEILLADQYRRITLREALMVLCP